MARAKARVRSSGETNFEGSVALIKGLGSQHLGVGFPGRSQGFVEFISKFEKFMRAHEPIEIQHTSTDLHEYNLFRQNLPGLGSEMSIPASGGTNEFQ